MRRLEAVACAALCALTICGLAGCGGGGGATAGATALDARHGDNRPPTLDVPAGATARTGTVRFNVFGVAALSIVPDSDTNIYTPVNPPESAFDGERVQFAFVPAQAQPNARPQGRPILLLAFQPL